MNWHTPREAAPLIGVSAEMVYLLCSSGRLAHRRVGIKPGRGKIQISDADIAAYLESCRVPVAPQGQAGTAPATGAKKRPKTCAISGRPDGKPIKYEW